MVFYKNLIYLPILPRICFRLSLQNYRSFTQILVIKRTIFWSPSPLRVEILRDSPSVLVTYKHGSNWPKQLLLLEASLWKLKWTITSIIRYHRVKFSFQSLKSIKVGAHPKNMLHPFPIEMLVISYQFTCDQIYRKLQSLASNYYIEFYNLDIVVLFYSHRHNLCIVFLQWTSHKSTISYICIQVYALLT